MNKSNWLNAFLLTILFFESSHVGAQQMLWFGTVSMGGTITQGRFEVFKEGYIKSVVFAPYGRSPTTFKDLKRQPNKLEFSWQFNGIAYLCQLAKKDTGWYEGPCSSAGSLPVQLIMREFTPADAILQGDSLHAALTDIQILDRAIALLNNGKNWNRDDKRICDNSAYPYQWSLFCALHQASIDIDSEYKHLRPAIQSARQAINEFTSGKQYGHLLQDFNNEARSFDSISWVLNRAREIILEKIRHGQ